MILGGTGKFFSEALILASPNPQYYKRLFVELPVQHMKTTRAEHGQNMARTCSAHVLPMFCACVFMYWTGNSMNNLLSYCGLIDPKIRAPDKDLPVSNQKCRRGEKTISSKERGMRTLMKTQWTKPLIWPVKRKKPVSQVWKKYLKGFQNWGQKLQKI